MRISRLVLALCSLLLAFGSVAHAKAFRGAARAIGNATLPSIYANDFKALWLADSATLGIVAVFFGFIAARPSSATPLAVLTATLIPAATAILIYMFVGNFFAGHLLLGTSVAALAAGLQVRSAA